MKRLFTFFALLLLAQSCVKDADVSLGGGTSSGAVSFTASVVDMSGTRATLINSWSGDEQVALFWSGDEEPKAYCFTVAADGTMSSDDKLIVVRDKEYTYTAFYPYDENLTTIAEYEAAYTAGSVDYMSATTTTTGESVELQFEHKLAALSFTIMFGSTEVPKLYLALDGELSSAVSLDVEVIKTNSTLSVSQLSANYFVEEGDLSSAIIKVESDDIVGYCSIAQDYTLEVGKQYPFTCSVGVTTGSGAADDPYVVYSADDMRKVGTGTDDWSLGSCYILAWDIDLGDKEFTAIGSYFNEFKGTFDGDGHEISGLYINSSDYDYQGLFGKIDGATIKNLGVRGSVTGNNRVGGVVGYAENSTVSGCNNAGSVQGLTYVGGVVGYATSSSTVSDCYSTGSVEGTDIYVGGVVGYANSSSTVSDCYNAGSVQGLGTVGGVVGFTTSTVSDCYNTGSVEGTSYYVGGVVGYAAGSTNVSSTVSYCYSAGTVKGTFCVGGIAGYIGNSEMSGCYNTGSVDGTSTNVGGIAGQAFSTSLSDCYNMGSVCSTSSYVGGVVGNAYSSGTTVNCCYSAGLVKGDTEVGGIAGSVYYYYSVSYCYYDSDVASGINAVYDGIYSGEYSGLSTEEMKNGTLLNYFTSNGSTSWSTDTQNINNGYPILTWQTSNN